VPTDVININRKT